jgi:hypothetical protein
MNDTAEDRRSQQMAKEIAEWNDARNRAQRELDRWWQARLDFEADDDEWIMVGGFRERRYRTTCHRGRGDPDYGLK